MLAFPSFLILPITNLTVTEVVVLPNNLLKINVLFTYYVRYLKLFLVFFFVFKFIYSVLVAFLMSMCLIKC